MELEELFGWQLAQVVQSEDKTKVGITLMHSYTGRVANLFFNSKEGVQIELKEDGALLWQEKLESAFYYERSLREDLQAENKRLRRALEEVEHVTFDESGKAYCPYCLKKADEHSSLCIVYQALRGGEEIK